MKLALIPPFSQLRYTHKTNYQLMLPQLMYDERYNFTYGSHCKDPEQFVMLDNGANEEADVDWEELVGIAIEYRPSELIIPDVIGDYARTMHQANEFINVFGHELVEAGIGLMFVIQGTTFAQFMQAARWATKQDMIDTIAIPRHAPKTVGMHDIRAALASRIWSNSDKTIHFLGCPLDPAEPHLLGERFKNIPRVRGLDTSMPFNWAEAGILINLAVKAGFPKRVNDYFEQALADEDPEADYKLSACDKSVKTMIRWVER